MGRNNRQRRAAKQKIRTQRGPTPPRSHDHPHWPHSHPPRADQHAAAEEFSELFDLPPESAFSPPRATSGHRPPPTVTARAQRLVDTWIQAAWRWSDDAYLRSLAQDELRAADAEVIARADELLAGRLVTDLARLWSHGWQPRDLLHVTQRIDRRAAQLSAELILEQLRRSGRRDHAPEGWREQLEAVEQRVRRTDPIVDTWRPLDRLRSSGAGFDEALASTLRLVVRLGQLPPLAMTLPPPASWRETPRAASTPSRPASTADSRRDKVLTRIRALLAKAESTEHAAEAETFTAKAQDLMTRHAVDEALLHAGATESIDVRSRRVLIDNPYPLEKAHLLNEVALANRVKVIWEEDLAIATAVGTPVDIDQVEMLFVSLLIQATRAMAEAGASRAGSFDRSPRFRRSFLTSYAIRIGERLKDADQAATASYGTELVPVLRRQQEAVEEEFDRLFPKTTKVPGRRSYDRRGWDAGRQAADQATFVAGRIAG